MATVFIEKINNDHVRFVNDSGADLEQYEPCVVGPYAAVADEAIASTETGSFAVQEGIQVQASNLTATQDTFATPGQAVYLDAAGDFSDTSTAGYYLWGYLVEAKNANGVIIVEKLRYATVVPV